MANPAYPNVPQTAGVPPVKRDASNPGTGTETALESDGDDITVNGLSDWGIYKDDALVLEPDTIVSIDYDAESRIADYPIEEGGFESYDKVAIPFTSRVVMSKGGAVEDRRAFLAAVEEIRVDRELYSIVTPERSYPSVNISRISLRRAREQGGGMVTVEISFVEIRANATVTFSKAKDPASADTQSDGAVQAKDAPPEVQTRAAEKATPPANLAPGDALSGAPAKLNISAATIIQTVPLVAGIASQSLAVNLAQNAVNMVLSQKRTGLFADIAINGVQAVTGALCRDGVPLLKDAVPSFPGDLAFIDMIGSNDPDYSSLADRFQLIWAA
jgi:hypothetical protein